MFRLHDSLLKSSRFVPDFEHQDGHYPPISRYPILGKTHASAITRVRYSNSSRSIRRKLARRPSLSPPPTRELFNGSSALISSRFSTPPNLRRHSLGFRSREVRLPSARCRKHWPPWRLRCAPFLCPVRSQYEISFRRTTDFPSLSEAFRGHASSPFSLWTRGR